MAKVYVAGCEEKIQDLLAFFLREEGMEVETFAARDELLEHLIKSEADLLILDSAIADKDGFELIKTIRRHHELPIILLAAQDSDYELVTAFAAGVDDYFAKPFSPLKLTLQAKAILSRQYGANRRSDKLIYGGLALSPKSRSAFYQGQIIELTKTEFKLLKYLLERKEEAVARKDLLTEVWGYEDIVETRAADDTVKRLRKKLKAAQAPIYIETIWGYGFKLTKNN
ncbi:response regulator transcription factor [Streptococcus pantholopis]|uniref:DNA-binding response regulator n=1 Tax=Streptococcus pantholopis TaxID=1811193 RepID=A0A172Q692_9STRE|nr:response regulator transcription factor [Streptococcus pantholopis]AND78970.1 DNA-binding response regulator [Streptococcus pantholopis]